MKNDPVLAAFNSRTTHEGAPQSSIFQLEKWVKKQLPTPYVELMSCTNGVEGFVGENTYIELWPVERLIELNETYCVAEFAPGLLLIGSDGAGIGYALDTLQEPMSVKEVPFVGMSHKEAKTVALVFEGFAEFLKHR